jgi:predicted glutamine amidotransferase
MLMCKLLLMTGITEPLVAKEFMDRMSIPMSRSNRDGIGYTAVKSDGSMFSERWHNNQSFMQYDSIMIPDIAVQLEAFRSRLPSGALDTNYSSHGNVDMNDMRTVTMHTRFATCGKEFANTHPFIFDDVSLVHNGTIRNSSVLNVNKISTCDSESALQTYINKGVANDTTKAKQWLDMLTGSWAFGILSRNVDSKRILDVVRGSSSLYHAQVEGLGSVFVTDKDDLLSVAKDMSLNLITEPSSLELDSMFRFDAVSGELIETIDIKPKKFINPHYNSGYYGGYYSSYNQVSKKDESYVWDDDYNRSILSSSMNDSSSVIPDLTGANGKIDYRKVKKYCNDSNETFIDRLDVFDIVFNKNYTSDYESLPDDLRDYVKETDFLQGFKEARQLIIQLCNVKTIAR